MHYFHLFQGFDKVLWQGSVKSDSSVAFSYLAKDGEEGYPGNLMLNATYTLGEDNGLKLHVLAICDQATPVNIVNHAFFNLGKSERSEEQYFFSLLRTLWEQSNEVYINDTK